MNEHFRNNDLSITVSTKKNLRRNLEKCYGGKLKFIIVKNRLFLYSAKIKTENVIEQLLEERSTPTSTSKIAISIHKEINEMEDTVPWPPQPKDLSPEHFTIPNKLGQFLTVLLSGQDDEGKMSSRIERLRFSLAQDIVYIVTNGRVKSPKSVLLSSTIKQLTQH